MSGEGGMKEKQRLQDLSQKTQELGQDDMQKVQMLQQHHGLYKNQRLLVIQHHLTSILQQDKDSLVFLVDD